MPEKVFYKKKRKIRQKLQFCLVDFLKTIRWITMKLGADIHVPNTMN